MQTTEVVNGYDPKHLAAILEIDRNSFDEQYEDAEEYYHEALENPENINVFLKEGEKNVGYILAIPHNVALEDLNKVDPEMKADSKRFYVETIEILPDYRKGRGFLKMILTLIDEAGKRGVDNFSMHARVENGLSNVVQKYFRKMIRKVRRIENWPYYYNGEPTDYIEGTYDGKK